MTLPKISEVCCDDKELRFYQELQISYKLNSAAPGLAPVLLTGNSGSGLVLQVITCRQAYFPNFPPSRPPPLVLPLSSPPGPVYLTPQQPERPPYLRLNHIPPFGGHNGRTVWWRLCSGSGIPPLIRNLSFTDPPHLLWARYYASTPPTSTQTHTEIISQVKAHVCWCATWLDAAASDEPRRFYPSVSAWKPRSSSRVWERSGASVWEENF